MPFNVFQACFVPLKIFEWFGTRFDLSGCAGKSRGKVLKYRLSETLLSLIFSFSQIDIFPPSSQNPTCDKKSQHARKSVYPAIAFICQ